MPEKISILKESGETLSSNIVSVFMIPETNKRYIITTENAVDPHGLTVLHVSEIVDGILQKVATDEEWSSIKTIMRAIISGNVGSYKYLPSMESAKVNGQYSRDISVSAAASKQMMDNYAAGDKNDSSSITPASIGNNSSMNGMTPSNIVSPSSIFPTGNAGMVNNDNELIPGIAEVPVVANMAANQGLMGQNNANLGLQNANTLSSVNPLGSVETDISPSSVAVTPVGNGVNGMGQGINSGSPSITNTMQLSNGMVNAPNGIIGGMNSQQDSSNLVQVAVPTQVVPTAQIVQEAQAPSLNDVKIDFGAGASFDPKATLDEVVVGAQEMFMEGVKNLVQTIQEKVYRDLYAKEAELKKREEALIEKEKMINEQMMNTSQVSMMQPIAQPVNQMATGMMMQNNQPNGVINTIPIGMGTGVMPLNGMGQPQTTQIMNPQVVNGPMVVSAANDVI